MKQKYLAALAALTLCGSMQAQDIYKVEMLSGSDLNGKYVRVFKEGFRSADTAQNILVVKTVSGMAMAVAAALDNMQCDEIVGSIAGDDTIMCAVRTSAEAQSLLTRLKKMATE